MFVSSGDIVTDIFQFNQKTFIIPKEMLRRRGAVSASAIAVPPRGGISGSTGKSLLKESLGGVIDLGRGC